MICSYIVTQLAGLIQNFTMSRWTVQDTDWVAGYDEQTWDDMDVLVYFLSIYSTVALINTAIGNVVGIVICRIGLRIARKLHEQLLSHIMRAPVRWFDVTPVGRIVNRFTSDMASIDQSTIYQWAAMVQYILITATAVSVTSMVTPAILLVVIPVGPIFLRMQREYRASARELKRLNSIARSPIFQHFGETLSTLTTVRAYKAERRLIEKNHSNNDDWGRAMLAVQMCWRWLSMRLTGMSLLVQSFVVTWVCIHPHAMDAGLTAMCMNYSGQVTIYLQHLINCFTQLEIEMNSIERVKHYSEIDTEAAFDDTDPKAKETQLVASPKSWPSSGKIEFSCCSARYRAELPLVLTDVSFVVEARQKIGVCGRTGSGKSTLMQLLFRIIELDSRSIKIDGVDISTIGLRQLRTGIAILPQDPTLFAGTVRDNIE